jgi:hypothetical protein
MARIGHPSRMHLSGCRRTYDHRLRELAYHAGDPGIAQQLGVPRSTARSWIGRGMPDVVSLEVADKDAAGGSLPRRALGSG